MLSALRREASEKRFPAHGRAIPSLDRSTVVQAASCSKTRMVRGKRSAAEVSGVAFADRVPLLPPCLAVERPPHPIGSDDRVMNPSWWASAKESSDDLPPPIRSVIEQENWCDLELYRHARQAIPP